ncbi:Mo-dependent nitrogenase C-terminal domain-containing protein [Oscillatoriales cyanobacterium LEGE 11467]|uniref:Mo-dependent nitrogenase C-terminal domain-containing protein n=1 Tax=Zarconia navalis LEGE 11467 TaxID=1828826 RepID=A0A928Z6B1_9CYAN|nr:Mo-dependent nitrogenase C-terminal domain-containing protein [Zarconia navalis]MBE9039280.1 Mo-dependent nitrogenase C-terminal domain-containing protein [Zarconia navalis LEGE 11467]
MSVMNDTIQNVIVSSWVWLRQTQPVNHPEPIGFPRGFRVPWLKRFAPLQPLRKWLDGLTPNTPKLARRICQLVPAQCPFEREVKWFDAVLFRIPPLCKLNPLYDEVVSLRFRALCYLADECGEDISSYC